MYLIQGRKEQTTRTTSPGAVGQGGSRSKMVMMEDALFDETKEALTPLVKPEAHSHLGAVSVCDKFQHTSNGTNK
jgi:hypothetical protein